MRLSISIRGRVRRSVGPVLFSTKEVVSYVPMMTKFNMDQEKVKDNSEVTSKCWSIGVSVHPTLFLRDKD